MLGFALLALLVQRGMRLLTVSLLGRLLCIWKEDDYLAYRQAVFNPYRWLFSMGLVVGLSWWLTRYYLEPFYILYFQSETRLLVAIIWNALMGGVLVESIGNIITLLMIRGGKDPRRTLWDNLIAGVIAIGLLYYFQNNWISIGSGLLLGSLTGLLHKFFGFVERTFPR